MSGARQLVFGFEHRPALGAESFLVDDGNRAAVAWIDRWPAWPGGALALCGPPGAGKSHLASVWRRRCGAVPLPAAELDAAFLDAWPGAGAAVALEDGDRGICEDSLFHLVNLVREDGGHLLLTARLAPARWPVALPDLASRLAALPVATLTEPGDGLLAAVLAKQFQDRQLAVPDEVVAYLVARMERSFAAAAALVAALDGLSLAEHRAITVPLARRALAAGGRAEG